MLPMKLARFCVSLIMVSLFHCFIAGSPYPGQPGAYGQYGSGDQYNATGPPGQFGQQQGQFPPQNRSMYPPYGPEGEA